MAHQNGGVHGTPAQRFEWSTSIGLLGIMLLEDVVIRVDLPPSEPPGVEGQFLEEKRQTWMQKWRLHEGETRLEPPPRTLKEAIESYLAGESRDLEIPVLLHGTEFQKRVWGGIQSIPYGEVETYGSLAKRLESPSASRAIGLACGANPVPLLIPCHRVVAQGGRIGGFGGGLDLKRRLLTTEAAVAQRPLPFPPNIGTFQEG